MSKDLLFSITKSGFEIQTFRSGGPGGQHQNKTESGVRIIHKASGAVGESRTEKSQHANKKAALQRLTETTKFKVWMNNKVYEIKNKESIEETVDKQLDPKFIKIEINEDGKWKQTTFDIN